MHVCVSPRPAATVYTRQLYEAIEAAGVHVEPMTVRRLITGADDVVHLHWPEWQLYARPYVRMVWRASLNLTALGIARARGARVVWTVHNVTPHEPTPQRFSRLYWWILTRLVDGVISPSRAGLDAVRIRFAQLAHRPSVVIPLGHMRGRHSDHGSRSCARAHLGIPTNARVVVCFGLIRPYKGVPTLVRRFRELDDRSAVLVVAGRPLSPGLRAEIEVASDGDDRIRLHLDYVPDHEVQHYLRAADLVVLPYTETSNSAAALLALSFDRPILAPAAGAFPELADHVGPRWVRLYNGVLTAATLASSLDAVAHEPPAEPHPDLAPYDWDTIGRETVEFFHSLIV